MKPFETPDKAKEAAEDIMRRRFNFSRVTVARIRLEIAENDEEAEGFFIPKKPSVIVIGTTSLTSSPERKENEFLGLRVEGHGRIGHLPGSALFSNGIQPFESADEAKNAAREAARQGQWQVTLAKFSVSFPFDSDARSRIRNRAKPRSNVQL